MIIRGSRVVTPDGIGPSAVHIRDGRIAAVTDYDQIPPGAPLVEVGDALLLPGLVDTHVHTNEPGRTEWEGFETATRAAAAGGVTTLVEMPLNSVPATTGVANFCQKLEAARGKSHVDVAFWGGVVPGNQGELRPLWDAGVLGFKCFLAPSGVDEFPHVGEADLRAAMPVLAELGAPLLVHAELPGPLELAAAALPGADPLVATRRTLHRVRGPPRTKRSPCWSGCAVSSGHECTWSTLHRRTPSRSSEVLVQKVCRSRRKRVRITCTLRLRRSRRVPRRAQVRSSDPGSGEPRAALECAGRGIDRHDRFGSLPVPTRDEGPRYGRLHSGVGRDCIPAAGALRDLGGSTDTGLYVSAPGRVMSRAPARLAGLEGCKGAIAPGYDADLVVWDPDAEYSVEPGMLHHRHKLSPYVGQLLPGVVRATYLRGEKIYDRGEFPSAQPGAFSSEVTDDAI